MPINRFWSPLASGPERAGLVLGIAIMSVTAPTAARANVTSDLRAIDMRLKACTAKDDSNTGMKICTNDAYQAADRVLNGIYEAQVAKLHGGSPDDQETLKRLVSAERAWITFRDADCNLQGTSMLGGSGESLVIVGCLYDAAKQRAKGLDDLFKGDK